MANTKPKELSKTFIDLKIALSLPKALAAKLRREGITYTFQHLDEVLRHPKMLPTLAKQLTKVVTAIVEREGKKYPRPSLRPKKDWSRQF